LRALQKRLIDLADLGFFPTGLVVVIHGTMTITKETSKEIAKTTIKLIRDIRQ
jgi:hypothetical protein